MAGILTDLIDAVVEGVASELRKPARRRPVRKRVRTARRRRSRAKPKTGLEKAIDAVLGSRPATKKTKGRRLASRAARRGTTRRRRTG